VSIASALTTAAAAAAAAAVVHLADLRSRGYEEDAMKRARRIGRRRSLDKLAAIRDRVSL